MILKFFRWFTAIFIICILLISSLSASEFPCGKGRITAAFMRKDKVYLVSEGKHLCSLESATGKMVSQKTVPDYIKSIAVSINSQYLIAGTSDGRLQIYSAFNFQLFKSWPGHHDQVRLIKTSDKHQFVSMNHSKNSELKIWSLPIGASLNAHYPVGFHINDIAIKPDKFLYFTTEKGIIREPLPRGRENLPFYKAQKDEIIYTINQTGNFVIGLSRIKDKNSVLLINDSGKVERKSLPESVMTGFSTDEGLIAAGKSGNWYRIFVENNKLNYIEYLMKSGSLPVFAGINANKIIIVVSTIGEINFLEK